MAPVLCIEKPLKALRNIFPEITTGLPHSLQHKKRSPRLWLGTKGEKHIGRLYQNEGYYIWHRNWKHKHVRGEIDIIAYKDNCLHFIEVKSRFQKNNVFRPLDSVGIKKQKQLEKLAQVFWEDNRRECMLRRIRTFQIDLAGIVYQKKRFGRIRPVSIIREY